MKKLSLRRWKAVVDLEAAKKDARTVVHNTRTTFISHGINSINDIRDSVVRPNNIPNYIDLIQNGADGVSDCESVIDVSEIDSNENYLSDTDEDEYFYNKSGDTKNSSESNGAESDFEKLYCERDEVKSSRFNISRRRILNILYFFSQLKSLKHKGIYRQINVFFYIF